jgi:transcriptional regulator with XRE-family HTH domain
VSDKSPTVRRRRLAAELRRLREAAGLTHEDVAAELDWHRSKVGRIESAQFVRLSTLDLRGMLDLYGIKDERQRRALTTLAKEARQRDWWHTYSDMLPNPHSTFIGLEAETASIRTYQAQLVPALLQTENYTRAMTKALRMITRDTDEVERFVEVRKTRQERRLYQDPAITLWAVLDEAVLRRRVGGSAVMAAQLEHLVDSAELPHVTLQVLPDEVGEHAALEGSFMILGFPEPTDPDVVYLDAATGGVYVERPEDIDRYVAVFDHVRAAALGPKESVSVIERRLNELR